MRSARYVTAILFAGLLVDACLPSWSQGMTEAGALQGLPGIDGSLGQGLTRGFGAGRAGGASSGVAGGVQRAPIDEEKGPTHFLPRPKQRKRRARSRRPKNCTNRVSSYEKPCGALEIRQCPPFSLSSANSSKNKAGSPTQSSLPSVRSP
jgi:hypothetical protein